jgi:hypothetical protein
MIVTKVVNVFRRCGWNMQFAKVREEQGQLAEAAVEYERGGDTESAVRLLLQESNVDKAFGISRRSGSATAAALIVKHSVEQSNWAGAVEFSIVAGDYSSAWQVPAPSSAACSSRMAKSLS